jgi:quinoprotein glucose dehydrogenase
MTRYRFVLALFVSCIAACGQDPAAVDYAPAEPAEWPSYGGAPGGGHYSPAAQITKENVHALTRAWEWRSGHWREPGAGAGGYDSVPMLPGSSWQMTPLILDGTLFGCTAFGDVFALDASTGEPRWRFSADVDPAKEVMINCRGVSSWRSGAQGHCEHRIFSGTPDGRLIALDALTGEACADFGARGVVKLAQGLGEYAEHEYSLPSPPAILGNLAIIGSWVLDRAHDAMPSGVVRAYDVRSGKLAWYWDAIPPGEQPQLDSEGRPQYRRGTTNVWSIISVDPERNLVFLPTGNTSTDFYGVKRNGLDHWSSAVVALNGSTGEVVWRFQMVHHDLWDYDTPAQPTLFELERDGQRIPALAQPTKMGHLFILHRETGEPLFPVEERPVPQEGAVPGEKLSPTQPFPVKPAPLVKAGLTPDDAWGFTFWDRNACRREIASLRSEGIFTPPSIQGSVMAPGDMGGNNWGTPAIDPVRGLIVLNTLNMPQKVRLIPRESCELGKDPRTSAQLGTPYCVQVHPLLSPLGAPCVAPPWSTLVAIDMHTGNLRWEVPLGNLEGLAPWPLSRIQGAPSVGGPSVSAGGLTFIAATTDAWIRAFDTDTGEELWKAELPTGGHATPGIYTAPQDGRQYVVIAAGGHWGVPERPTGDHLIAFALPRTRMP